MRDANIYRFEVESFLIKLFLYTALFIGLLGIGLFVNNVISAQQPSSLPTNTEVISQSALEEKYGLRVNLIAVTAAGGMIDLRLKIIDGEKAKLLLQDKKNFPALLVGDGDLTLIVPEETKAQEIKFENGGDIFLLFPNAGNAVKPGTPITVVFGNTALEPIDSR